MKYGLFCPLQGIITASSSIACTKLIIPTDKGLTFSGSWAGVSTNTGNLVGYCEKTSTSNIFAPGTLILVTKTISITK